MHALIGGRGTVGLEIALEVEVVRVLASKVVVLQRLCNVSSWGSWKLGWPESDTAAFADLGTLGWTPSESKEGTLLGVLKSGDRRQV